MIIAIRFTKFGAKAARFYPNDSYPKHYFETDKPFDLIEATIKESLEKIPDGNRMEWLKKQFDYLGTKPEKLWYSIREDEWYLRRTNYKEKTENN